MELTIIKLGTNCLGFWFLPPRAFLVPGLGEGAQALQIKCVGAFASLFASCETLGQEAKLRCRQT